MAKYSKMMSWKGVKRKTGKIEAQPIISFSSKLNQSKKDNNKTDESRNASK